jgi:predicted SAM-dependent methyltransferase
MTTTSSQVVLVASGVPVLIRQPCQVIVGAGGTWQEGWLSLDESELDITRRDQWARRFLPSSLSSIFAEHVWEHLTYEEGTAAARNCYEFLRRGGCLRIAVPDGYHTDARYIAWVRPGTGYNGDDHKVLFTYKTLSELLTRAGFTVVLREWFDERGAFHAEKLDPRCGDVRRSYHTWYSKLLLSTVVGAEYTSLIVDAFKL